MSVNLAFFFFLILYALPGTSCDSEKCAVMSDSAVSCGSVVSDPKHSCKVLRALRSFREENCFQDAVLVLDGEEIPVQKNILAAASPYIRYIFILLLLMQFLLKAAYVNFYSNNGFVANDAFYN